MTFDWMGNVVKHIFDPFSFLLLELDIEYWTDFLTYKIANRKNKWNIIVDAYYDLIQNYT